VRSVVPAWHAFLRVPLFFVFSLIVFSLGLTTKTHHQFPPPAPNLPPDGWTKVSRPGPPVPEFKHDSFQRGRPGLLRNIQRKANDYAGSQRKRVVELGTQLDNIKDLIASLQTGLIQAMLHANAAEERAARAEMLMGEMRAANNALHARVSALEGQPLHQAHHLDVDEFGCAAVSPGVSQKSMTQLDGRSSGNVGAMQQPQQIDASATKATGTKDVDNHSRMNLEIEFWDRIYEGQQEQEQQEQQEQQQQQQQQQPRQNQEPERKRPRTDLTFQDPTQSALSGFSPQSWTGAAATAQAVALAAAASAVGVLPTPSSTTGGAANRMPRYQTSSFPTAMSQVSLSTALSEAKSWGLPGNVV
jgi:hypothetical protein